MQERCEDSFVVLEMLLVPPACVAAAYYMRMNILNLPQHPCRKYSRSNPTPSKTAAQNLTAAKKKGEKKRLNSSHAQKRSPGGVSFLPARPNRREEPDH